MDAQASSAAQPRCFAFIFGMASGHINPSLPIARGLVEMGHEVHYLCREQMREPIEDTGATFHSEIEQLPEMYEGREAGLFGAMEDLKKEYGIENSSMMVSISKLKGIMVEMMLPGVLRWLRKLRPSAVVFCPMINQEASTAAKILGIPGVALVTTAGPGSIAKAITEFLRMEGLEPDDVLRMQEAFVPLQECLARMTAKYGVDLDLKGFYKPMGKMPSIVDSALTLVTTCEALQDPMTPELAQAYEDAKVRFECVGPLLGAQGARRAAGHKYRGEEEHQDSTERRNPVELVREARAAGRKVVLVSMGTVITGDSEDFGWDARLRGADGQLRGLTGGELCRAAWGGAFDAFGAESPEEGPLMLVSLGPQPDALGDLQAPANAFCVPSLPQVDVLKEGVDLFLTHGGQNSFTESLSVGSPVVVCPGFGDQVVNAQKAASIGVGLQVDRPMPDEGQEKAAAAAYRAEVSAALHRVFEETTFRSAAEECAEQLRVAGGVPRAVSLVLSVSTEPAVAASKCAEAEAFANDVPLPRVAHAAGA